MKPNNGAINTLENVNNVLLQVETFMLATFTIGLVGVIFIEVICRYLLYISTAWSEELARYLFIWLTYIGSAYALNQGAHIEIDVFKQAIEKTRVFKNKERDLKMLEMFSITSTIVFSVIFCKIYWEFMMKFWGSAMTSPTMHIPMVYIYLPVFIGSIMGIYHLLYLLCCCIMKKTGAENS